ncbi:hypothetical protein HMPREF9333_02150 [Johnsonella ignava ATCC 51276]|uniref:Solute-binding protein family 3/N-terminal domain-containing protein n=3 Tax=Johnsonella TaxID=43994 RepID=G5GKQ6_9FIRM|nr:hypothetical protein HMPREF9333_02150 [Johnsonella ignava ATCC 51276]
MAILCKDAAKTLVENNKDLEIVCPLFQNTDVIVKKNEHIKKIAIQQSKFFHEEYLLSIYPESLIIQTNRTALAYAYESKQVDAVFIDIAKSGGLEGIREYPDLGDTFVLVAVKGYKDSSDFKAFAKVYNEAVDILNEDVAKRNSHIARYTDLKEVDGETWKVKLLKIKK